MEREKKRVRGGERGREGRKEMVHEKSRAEGLRLSWMARTWGSWKRASHKMLKKNVENECKHLKKKMKKGT